MRRAPYEKLVTWQRSMDLVAFVYRLVKVFPDSEKSGLSAALKKAVAAIPGKIAEADQAQTPEEATKGLAGAQKAMVDLYNQALIARRVKVMGRGPLVKLRARCRKLDRLIERELVKQSAAIEAAREAGAADEPEDVQHVEGAASEPAPVVATPAEPSRVARVVMRRRPRINEAA